MKVKIRVVLFIGVVILLSFCMLFSNEATLFELLNVETLTIYTSNNLPEFETKLSGNGYSFACDTKKYKDLNCDIQGISFQTHLNPKQIFEKLNLRIQSRQRILTEDGIMEIYYCFLENIDKSVVVENKKVNLQIVFKDEVTILGIPLVLGSY